MSIATVIRDQLGGKTLFMLGAKNLLDCGDAFSFRIRGSKAVNYIKITLNAMDTYDMEFGKIWGAKYTVVSLADNIYCDGLHSMIRKETGLATNL